MWSSISTAEKQWALGTKSRDLNEKNYIFP